jgi:hypothetical protein
VLAVVLVVGGSVAGAVGIGRDPRLSASEAALEEIGGGIDAAGSRSVLTAVARSMPRCRDPGRPAAADAADRAFDGARRRAR